MGMDSVEIVQGIEETLGISISDDEAQHLRTPRAVVALVAERVSAVDDDGCTSRTVLRALQRGLAQHTGRPAGELVLDTPLRSIAGKRDWPGIWDTLRARAGTLDWPATIPWPGLMQEGPRTLGDLVLEVCMALPAPSRGQPWTRESIGFALRRVVRDVMAIRSYRSGERFVEDMGID